ncbi:M23 family metallopeptidase [Streptomyces sp. Je 1-332]|uniref:M23 family metallopeptidase n=1 Tax=Streptomyces sp. Je 1-332 TaxID=3231270 RepID=UPI003458A6FA
MRLSHRGARHPLVAVTLLLCALLCPTPAGASEEPGEGAGDGPGASAEVARLYEEASLATARYEVGRYAAEAQRAKVRKLNRLLKKKRRAADALHADLGRLANAQYRSGGALSQAAQLLLAESPEELMRGRRLLRQADLAATHTVDKTRRAAARLADAKRTADRAERTLDRRSEHLAELKRGIESKLEAAQWTLQGEADRAVAAGQCRGAVRLDQPETVSTRAWTAPVETYELSAGFDSAGGRWSHRHTGQDFAVGIGAPVRSVGAGRVVSVSCGGAFGIAVLVEHEDGYYTQYAHLAAVTVDQGERVDPGQWVGQAGTTGNSTGPHLHFEVRLTPQLGSGVDPVEWLDERGVRL